MNDGKNHYLNRIYTIEDGVWEMLHHSHTHLFIADREYLREIFNAVEGCLDFPKELLAKTGIASLVPHERVSQVASDFATVDDSTRHY